MSAGNLVMTLYVADDGLAEVERGCDALAAMISAFPDVAEKVRNYIFPGGELRPGFFSISSVPALRTDYLAFRFDLTDEFRELVRALATGEFDGEIIELTAHPEPPCES